MINNAQFHHVGMAVHSIDAAAMDFEALGYEVTSKVEVTSQKAWAAYATKKGSPTIELLEPSAENSPVQKVLARGGAQPYHICYVVPCIPEALAELKKQKFMPLTRPFNGEGVDNATTVFIFKKSVGVIQLVESNK